MAGLIDRIGPVKLRPRRLPPFQSLTHAVIHQQLSGQAAGTILGRFRALFGDDGFPTPEAVLKASPERLRSAGLSRPKASYVLGIAQKRLRSKPATCPVETLSAPRYFLPATCFAAAACFFFSAAALALTCFCATCLCTDFGDLSPIFTLPFFDGLLPGCV